MKSEQLIAKKVKHHFNAAEKQVLFEVKSLEEHYDGLLIHESDIIDIESEEISGKFVKEGDVNMDDAVSKEVAEENESVGMTYEEAEKLLKEGELIALPGWGGFWFYNFRNEETLVLTKEGEITETPWEICKERNDWQVVEATEEQYGLVNDYFDKDYGFVPNTEDILEIEVNAETLDLNPEFVEAGIEVGDTITVDAVEDARIFDKESITEVPKTIIEHSILKVDYVEQPKLKAEQIIQGIAPDGVSIDLDTIEEIIPAKVVKKKTSRKK